MLCKHLNGDSSCWHPRCRPPSHTPIVPILTLHGILRLMEHRLRVVTWNCRRASTKSSAWDYLLELDPDVALLQDFGPIPDRVTDGYSCAFSTAPAAAGRSIRHFTGVLVKGDVTKDILLPAPTDWVARELDNYKEFFCAREVVLSTGVPLNVMSVYSPAIPIDKKRLQGIDTTGIKLTHSRDLWATELMWATLGSMNISEINPFIVAGDLNSSETFDYLWSGGPRGNLEIMERMNALGFTECLRSFQGKLTPTFRTPRGGMIIHQLDHIYVTSTLLQKLTHCDTGSIDRVFGPSPMLSDHLPIVADFISQN